MTGDGFDRNVAGRCRNQAAGRSPFFFPGGGTRVETPVTASQMQAIPEKQGTERRRSLSSPQEEGGGERAPNVDVTGIWIEDLHHQLLCPPVHEGDGGWFGSSRRTLQQLGQDNSDLRQQIEDLNRDLQSFKMKEEEFVPQRRRTKRPGPDPRAAAGIEESEGGPAQANQEKEEALRGWRPSEPERSRRGPRIRGNEGEGGFSLLGGKTGSSSSLEKALDQNLEMEAEYEALRNRFGCGKESLPY